MHCHYQMSMLIKQAQILSAAILLFFNFNFTFISSTEATSVQQFDWVQQEFLKSHNDLRASVGVSPLQWDSTLATFSLSWANQLKQQCNYRHHSTSPYGENIFWEVYRQNTATSVVQKWFAEKQLFNHATNLCTCQPERAGCECGHYLNVVWRATKKVGCSGFVYCDDQKGAIVVCSYDPIGNVKGVNPLNPSNNAGDTSTVSPQNPVNTSNARRARGRKHNLVVKSPASLRQPSNSKNSQRGRGRRN